MRSSTVYTACLSARSACSSDNETTKAMRRRIALHSTSCEMRDQAFSVLRSFRSARASSRRFPAYQCGMRIAMTCLALLIAFATASGQTPPRKPLRTEPLEKYDMPPAYIYRLETRPPKTPQHGPFTSFQVNVDANHQNILGDAANEPSIAVDPTDGNKMTIGWRQFNTVNSNFRQGGWGYTTDGGTTWTFPGVLENNVFRSDPVTNSNETGTFFYLSLLQSFCDNIWRSTNGGQSWTELQADGAAGGGDKEWFAIDKTAGTGHGFQYQAWSTAAECSFGQFSRSTDGGSTWQTPINIPNSVVWGTLDVAT